MSDANLVRCPCCNTEFWSDCTGDNCAMDYLDRTLRHCCPTCGNTSARHTPANEMSVMGLVHEMRELAKANPSVIRYVRLAELFQALDGKVF